jgi:hypothetical protein
MLCVITLFYSGHAAARSAASKEPVCLGGELTLNCSTNGTLLLWEVAIPHRTPELRFIITVPNTTVNPFNPPNVAQFYFMKTSISPLVSMILIENVSIGLNGTRVEYSAGGEVIEATVLTVIENGIVQCHACA